MSDSPAKPFFQRMTQTETQNSKSVTISVIHEKAAHRRTAVNFLPSCFPDSASKKVDFSQNPAFYLAIFGFLIAEKLTRHFTTCLQQICWPHSRKRLPLLQPIILPLAEYPVDQGVTTILTGPNLSSISSLVILVSSTYEREKCAIS